VKKKKQNKQQNFLIKKSNSLITAKFDFTIIENRLFNIVIEKLQEIFNDNAAVDSIINRVEDITLHFNKDKLEQTHEHITNVIRILDRFCRQQIFIYDYDNKERICLSGLLTATVYNYQTHNLQIDISKRLLPYVFGFRQGFFTQYDNSEYMLLKSVYSQRLYELCQAHKYLCSFTFSVDDMRDILCIAKTEYTDFYEFRRRVLERGKQELYKLYTTGQISFYFEYEPDKTSKQGKNYTRINFRIRSNEVQELQANYHHLCLQHMEYYLENSRIVNSLKIFMLLHPDKCKSIYAKIQRIIQKYKYKKQISAVLKKALYEDYLSNKQLTLF
jgi:hypothetical protein